MPYHFATTDQDFSDFASGRVLYSLPGQSAFPVRLASEIFQGGLAHRQAQGGGGPVRLYDPCCGAGYLLAVLGFLHGEAISKITASDIEGEVLGAARRNLGLLSPEGLEQRIVEIRRMLLAYGKPSHQAALESALRLQSRLQALSHPLETAVFQADAADPAVVAGGLAGDKADLVLVDVPYGWHSAWQFSGQAPADPLWTLLEALKGILATGGVVGVMCAKEQKPAHPAFRRLERMRMGKRQGFFLSLIQERDT